MFQRKQRQGKRCVSSKMFRLTKITMGRALTCSTRHNVSFTKYNLVDSFSFHYQREKRSTSLYLTVSH